MKAGLILDRDGTLIEHIPYLSDPAQVCLLPGVEVGLKHAIDKGVKLFLHTNQSGVGRGMFRMPDVHACNEKMIELLGLGSRVFEKICIAPESPEAPSRYRKPSPEFALELMKEFGFQARHICYIGDRVSDLLTAKAAGTHAVGLCTGQVDLRSELSGSEVGNIYPICDSFEMAITLALNAIC